MRRFKQNKLLLRKEIRCFRNLPINPGMKSWQDAAGKKKHGQMQQPKDL
jgi:hypothetical protein